MASSMGEKEEEEEDDPMTTGADSSIVWLRIVAARANFILILSFLVGWLVGWLV